MDTLKKLIREVPDFPKPGILFYDITTLLKDPAGCGAPIDGAEGALRRGCRRGDRHRSARFIFAPALATRWARASCRCASRRSCRPRCQRLLRSRVRHRHSRNPRRRDPERPPRPDCGRPAGHRRHRGAATQLVEELGGTVAGLGFVVELTFLNGRGKLDGTMCFRCCSTTNDGAHRCRLRAWRSSISTARPGHAVRTAITSCAPFSRPFHSPIAWRSRSRRRARFRSRWRARRKLRITWRSARRGWRWRRAGKTGAVRLRLRKRIPRARGWAAVRPTRRLFFWRLPVLGGFRDSRWNGCWNSRRSSAATCRFSLWRRGAGVRARRRTLSAAGFSRTTGAADRLRRALLHSRGLP